MPISLAHNPVERVVAALRDAPSSITIPVEVIRDASEQYRLLATRIPVGSIQLQPSTQKDTAERRAAALLEYCARRATKRGDADAAASQPLTWAAVAAAVHAKSPAALQQLQNILISFLQPVVVNNKGMKLPVPSKTQPNDHRKASATSNYGISLRQKFHQVNYKDTALPNVQDAAKDSSSGLRYVPRILPELVIRLAGHLVDPNGTQKLACQLLHDIYSYYDRPAHVSAKSDRALDVSSYSNAAERRGHLYDLQRYSAAYEAAALFHVATTSMEWHAERLGGGARKGITHRRMTKKKRKSSNISKKSKDEALNTEEDDNDVIDSAVEENIEAECNAPEEDLPAVRSLQIDDLVEASSEFTYLEVKQVLPRVQTLAKTLLDRRADASTKEPGRLKPVGPLDADHIAKKRKQMKASEEDVSQFKDDSNLNSSPKFDAASSSQPSFAEWKESILTSVRSTTQAPADASIDVIMSLAADHVLRKHGLL